MMNGKDNCIRWILLSFFMLFLVRTAAAVSIGISPARVTFSEVLRGGYAEYPVTLSTDSQEMILTSFRTDGDIKGWVRLNPNVSSFNLSYSTPFRPTIIVEVPLDTPNGNYSGMVVFETAGFANPSGRVGNMVKAAVGLILSVEVTGVERPACRVGAFTIDDAEIGDPINFRYTVWNNGNVRLKPAVTLNIWDQAQKKVLLSDKITPAGEVLPTRTDELSGKVISNLPIGQYWASVRIDDCNSDLLLTFGIYERGGIIDNGELESITAKVWANVNENIPITAAFRNTGARTVTAQFKGNVMLDNKVVKPVSSDQIDVGPGDRAELTTYFTPDQPGRYLVTGRVIYNKKLSFEKGDVINVNQGNAPVKKEYPFLLLLLYLVIAVTILFLVRRIMIVKKGNKNKPMHPKGRINFKH